MNNRTRTELVNFENRIADLFDKGEIPYLIHLSGGNEKELVDIFEMINEGDYIFSTHRNHYHYLLAGGPPDHLEDLIMNGRSMFVFDRLLKFFSSSIVAGVVGIATGVAWALKRKSSLHKVWCFVGDGAEDEGHFYEAVRYVHSNNLPCTFVIEDNNRSVSATKIERWGPHFAEMWPDCVMRYQYTATWPHGGTGRNGHIKFKREAKVDSPLNKRQLAVGAPEEEYYVRKYKEAVKESMEMLSGFGAIFIGYNVRHGSAYGTLNDVPEYQRLETPVAENLMAGLAMGMSLEHFRPVLFFERHDFIFNALDALVNHLDKVEQLSDGEYRFPVIIRAVAGSVKPFYAGATHTSDYTGLFEGLFNFPVANPKNSWEVYDVYKQAWYSNGPVLISEPKELYEVTC